MTAYLDLIILENLCMNYIIIYTSGKILRKKMKVKKIIIASIIGSLYVFSVYANMSRIIFNLSKILVATLITKIGLESKSIRILVKDLIIFFMVSFMYSGCSLAFIHFMKPKVIYIVNGVIIGGEYIFEVVLISAIVSFFLIKIGTQIINIKQRLSKENMVCRIKIYNNKNYVVTKALLDTGNLLTDPVTGTPVVIVEKDVVKPLFDKNYFSKIESLIKGGDIKCNELRDTNIRVIPYMSVGNSNGIMIAYKMDRIKVEYQNEVYEINGALIGLYNNALTKNGKYSSLIGLQLLEGSKITDEYITDVKSKGKYSVC